MELDIKTVCGLSGYVHSCGRNVFVRNINKATKSHFFEALRRHLKRYTPGSKRIFFSVYAHEDFTEFDHEFRSSLKNGLDDVKIHVEKFFMGREHLVEILYSIRKEFGEQLAIPDPGDFRSQHKRLRDESDIDKNRTIWLITDYGVNSQDAQRSAERYFICYDQLYDNKNPFQVFDENKPGWYEHTTIPHTLNAAMINISVPYWPAQDVTLGDPFAGTGTTWLEGLKYPDLEVKASDISKLAGKAALDNAIFFSMDSKNLNRLTKIIKQVAKKLEEPEERKSQSQNVAVNELTTKVLKWAANQSWFNDRQAITILEGEDKLLNRILFYIALRTNKRHAPGLRRGSEEWSKAFIREAHMLSRQIERFIDIKAKTEASEETGALIECPGSYSQSVTVSLTKKSVCQSGRSGSVPVRFMDARSVGGKDDDSADYDVIITDPPYGFNTDEGPGQLAILYSDMLRAAIESLKPNGQLVICLPERSSIGKTPMTFIQKKIVTHQVLALANELNKEVLLPARSMPGSIKLFGPPFYWSSERALRRAILHFIVRPRSVVNRSEKPATAVHGCGLRPPGS